METVSRITVLRKERPWSQTELAIKNDVSVSIGKYEGGNASSQFRPLKRLRTLLKCLFSYQVDEVIYGKLNKKISKRLQDVEKTAH